MPSNTATAAAVMSLLSSRTIGAVLTGDASSPVVRDAIARVVDAGFASGASTVRALIWKCDRWLNRNYRNDHVYRRAIVEQMLPLGSAALLSEFKANRSVIDFVVVSQSLHAIEIKSDLDNPSRLRSQLLDYRKVAGFVSVLGTERLVRRLELELELELEPIGLHWLDQEGKVQQVRSAREDASALDSVTMMRSLRRAEYVRTVESAGFHVPDLPNTQIFAYAREIVASIEPTFYATLVAAELCQRRPKAGLTAIARLPSPIRPTVLKLDPTSQRLDRLRDWLDEEIRNVHAPTARAST